MNIEDMTVEDIERELTVREKTDFDNSVDLQVGGYLELARAEMRKNPANFIANNASVANKILELDSQALVRQNDKLLRSSDFSPEKLRQLTTSELQKLWIEDYAQFIPEDHLQGFYAIGVTFLTAILQNRHLV